ncbi:hypothetical protein EJ03DRAFT_312926 [Teratosphaeria nubilosa]|uniref:F-box domain-containing protein n=1 Tax=Teratosphaeria nubilosa TaxID=161662 RepID=A0A6G1L9P1_9PEZI|nr:hypothetical protein EJ03DRAFT_312926 [Teratosphaeria nubilosa]
MQDPLTRLPPELILKILEFAPPASLASLTRTSQAWHTFTDEIHQDVIYSSSTKTNRPTGSRDFDFLQNATSFAKYYSGTSSWKDLCRRQTLLPRNWDSERPVTTESVVQITNSPVWRFRPDFKRRFFVSTSQAGGLNVTDMDSGQLLWRLESTLHNDDTGQHRVRPYAHLEYQDGTACFDCEGDAIEVWKTELEEGMGRGEFRRVAVLEHNYQTRGLQLSYNTLCVVSTQGKGFVYDFSEREPKSARVLDIEQNAIGHLDQNEEVVMYSMGKGYHVHSKTTGELLTILDPSVCEDFYHVKHPLPRTATPAGPGRHGPTVRSFPPESPSTDRLTPITIDQDRFPRPADAQTSLEEDEWGAGMLNGDLMAGVSRGGRVLVCTGWKKALKKGGNPESMEIIECDADGTSFDLGGWLSVKNGRVMFEVQERVYVVALGEDGKVQTSAQSKRQRASWCYLTSSAPQLAVPVSFMALFDDCIMHTFTTLGWRQRNRSPNANPEEEIGPARIFPTKTIRVLSLAPDLTGTGSGTPSPVLWEPNRVAWEQRETETAQQGILRLVAMLGNQLEEEEDAMLENALMGLDPDDEEGGDENEGGEEE